MMTYPLTLLGTLAALAVYVWASIPVGQARGKFGVKAPAVTGHPEFERAFRAHQRCEAGEAGDEETRAALFSVLDVADHVSDAADHPGRRINAAPEVVEHGRHDPDERQE